MTGSRDAILASLRAARASSSLPEPPGPAPAGGGTVPQVEPAALVQGFARELAALGAVPHGPVACGDAVSAVLHLLREIHAHELIGWGEADLPVPGLREAVETAGFRLLDPHLPEDPELRRDRLRRLADADAGLTGALAGLADTGSLVLASGPGRPRLSWLLPPAHIALLPVAALRPSLAHFLAESPEAVRGNANLVLVTGPSRTADIELTPTRGVHGPGLLHVVLLLP